MKATTNQFLKDKLAQYQNGQLSAAEREIIDKWFDTNLHATENEACGDDQYDKQRYLELLTPLKQAIAQEKTKRYKLPYTLLKIACSIILITAISHFTYNKMNYDQTDHAASFQTYHTEKGKISTITLQDGTKIWMNGGTTIRVPSSFNSSKIRKVFLDTGEAFFNVKRDTSRPFSISTESLLTTVLGTSFNIRAYPEANVYQVAVATGKVTVAKQNGKQKTVLSDGLIKGQVLTHQIDASTTLINEQDATLISSWKTTRSIYINNLTLSQIGEELSRHYAIDVKVTTNAMANKTYNIHLPHQDLKIVLQQLALETGINYQLTKSQLTLNQAKQ
jgi:transmembrane sensor